MKLFISGVEIPPYPPLDDDDAKRLPCYFKLEGASWSLVDADGMPLALPFSDQVWIELVGAA